MDWFTEAWIEWFKYWLIDQSIDWLLDLLYQAQKRTSWPAEESWSEGESDVGADDDDDDDHDRRKRVGGMQELVDQIYRRTTSSKLCLSKSYVLNIDVIS